MSKQISFCFTHKNRLALNLGGETLPLFKNCLSTLKNQLDYLDLDYEICISSFDTPETFIELENFVIHTFSTNRYKLSHYDLSKFTRGSGRQLAFQQSSGQYIAFIDADMLFMRSCVIQRALTALEQNRAYFPVCYTVLQDGTGRWRPTGKGNCFVTKEMLDQVEWLSKVEWGGEDDKFMDNIQERWPVVRDQTPGWYHQWHPHNPNP